NRMNMEGAKQNEERRKEQEKINQEHDEHVPFEPAMSEIDDTDDLPFGDIEPEREEMTITLSLSPSEKLELTGYLQTQGFDSRVVYMKTAETIDKITPALIKFNSQVSKIAKDAENPFHKNNYATLDQIIDEVRPIMNENKLAILQVPNTSEEGHVTVQTIIMHESGQFFESDGTTLRLAKNDPQGAGAGITYARRYDLCAFLSLNTGDDDDGNSASNVGKKQNTQKTTKQIGRPTLLAKFKQGGATEDQFNDWLGKQVASGFDNNQMDAYLTKALVKKGKQ